MDIRAYIESGILEAYVLGSLPETERAQVQANMMRYPEVAAEVRSIEDSLANLARAQSVPPPKQLQEQIWAAVSASGNGRAATPKTIPFNGADTKRMQWKYAAAIIMLTGSVLLNIVLWRDGRDERRQRVALNEKVNAMQKEQERIAAQLEDYSKAKSMMADTGMQTIVMHTTVPGHPMAATVYWSKYSGATYVAMNALPAPPEGMQYQMWVIQGGKPVSMGMLQNTMANTPSMQKIPMTVTSGEAFAISLEKEGGNATPTTVYVMGKA